MWLSFETWILKFHFYSRLCNGIYFCLLVDKFFLLWCRSCPRHTTEIYKWFIVLSEQMICPRLLYKIDHRHSISWVGLDELNRRQWKLLEALFLVNPISQMTVLQNTRPELLEILKDLVPKITAKSLYLALLCGIPFRLMTILPVSLQRL